jgi:hypothetical protein
MTGRIDKKEALIAKAAHSLRVERMSEKFNGLDFHTEEEWFVTVMLDTILPGIEKLLPPEGSKVLVPKDELLPFVQGEDYWLRHGAPSTRSLVENHGRVAWVEWKP